MNGIFARGKAPFGSDDLSVEPTQGREIILEQSERSIFRRGAAPIVAKRMSEATSRKELGLA